MRNNTILCPIYSNITCDRIRGKIPEKAVYSLTEAGEREFERLMMEISLAPVNIFLDLNAVIVNLDSV